VVCIGSHLKLQILDTSHLDTLCLGEQICEDPWLFFEAGRALRAKTFRKSCYMRKYGSIIMVYGIVCVARNIRYGVHVNNSICFRVCLGSRRSVGSKNWPFRLSGIGSGCFVVEEGRG